MHVRVICAALCLILLAPDLLLAKTNGPKRKRVDSIIVHTISGPYTDCRRGRVRFSGAPGNAKRWKLFFDTHRSLGIHYVVDREGRVAASTSEDRVARHTMHNNATSIGIELVHNGDGKKPFGEPQISALIRLIKDIRRRHDIPVGRIVGHEDVDSRKFFCGGRLVKRKQDPGANFPWRRLRADVQGVPKPQPWVASVRRYMRGQAELPAVSVGQPSGRR